MRLRPFNDDEHKRIHAAIAALESRTNAHFALVVVPASERYVMFPILWAALIALVAGGALAAGWPALGLRTGFLVEAAVFIVLSVIFDWLPIRLLVPEKIKHHHARVLAHREFAARILAHTSHRNGLVFFVSMAERYVEIVADHVIHGPVDEAAWQRIVADFTATMKHARLGDNVVRAIDSCATLLETHFPKA